MFLLTLIWSLRPLLALSLDRALSTLWSAHGTDACTAARAAGVDAAEDDTRGLDHGVWVPLKLAFPDADGQVDLPIVELSILTSMDPEVHVAPLCCASALCLFQAWPLNDAITACMQVGRRVLSRGRHAALSAL